MTRTDDNLQMTALLSARLANRIPHWVPDYLLYVLATSHAHTSSESFLSSQESGSVLCSQEKVFETHCSLRHWEISDIDGCQTYP